MLKKEVCVSDLLPKHRKDRQPGHDRPAVLIIQRSDYYVGLKSRISRSELQ